MNVFENRKLIGY